MRSRKDGFMKKVSGILLAVAMAVSCLSIVTFAGSTVKGVKVEGTDTAIAVKTGNGYLTALGYPDDFTGEVSVKYLVRNLGDKIVTGRFRLMTTVEDSGKFTEVSCEDKITNISIGSEEEAYLEFTMNAKDGKVSGKFGAADREIALSKFFVRFDIWKEANLVIVPQKETADALLAALSSKNAALSIAGVDVESVTPTPAPPATPTPAQDATPTAAPTETPEIKITKGFKVTYNEETDGDHWILSQTGVFSAADIRDNKITKKFTVKNNGEDDIKIKVEFQVNHEKSEKGKFTWAGPHSGTYVLIPAGESEEIEYSMDVDAAGKVRITAGDNTVDYDVSKFFIRFDLEKGAYPEGTSYTVACDENIAKAFAETPKLAFASQAKVEYIYASSASGGDLLPTAFISVAAVAAAALVIVSRRKKEIL